MLAMGQERGMWQLVFSAYADPDLVREMDTQVKNSDIRQATSWGKAESPSQTLKAYGRKVTLGRGNSLNTHTVPEL